MEYQIVMFISGFRENKDRIDGKVYTNKEEAYKQAKKLNKLAELNGFQIEYFVATI